MADDITQLRHRIHREGYDTQKTGDGHYIVIGPHGAVVRHKSGKPFTLPSTPGNNPHNIKRQVSMLQDLEVLPRMSQAKATDNGKGDKPKLHRNVLKQYSDTLRPEVVQLMKEHDITQAQIVKFADQWAQQHEIAGPSWGPGVISKFLKGTTLTNTSYVWLTSALSAIRRNDGKIPSMGTHLEQRPDGNLEEVENGDVDPNEAGASIEVEGESTPRPPELPHLALSVMQAIYKEEKDHEGIMALVQEVARLELG